MSLIRSASCLWTSARSCDIGARALLTDNDMRTRNSASKPSYLQSIITIDNLDRMAMPVLMEVTTANGEKTRVTLPVEVWERNKSWDYVFPSTEKLLSVEIDPDKEFPDHNPQNNRWSAQ